MQQSEVAINYWELDFGFVFLQLSSIKYDDGSNFKGQAPVYLAFQKIIFLLGGFGYKNLNFLDCFFSKLGIIKIVR